MYQMLKFGIVFPVKFDKYQIVKREERAY